MTNPKRKDEMIDVKLGVVDDTLSYSIPYWLDCDQTVGLEAKGVIADLLSWEKALESLPIKKKSMNMHKSFKLFR